MLDRATPVVDNQSFARLASPDKLQTLGIVTFASTADFWDTRLQELRVLSDAYWREKQMKGSHIVNG